MEVDLHYVTAADVIGAIRLGLEAGASNESALALIEKLLEYAEPTEGASVEPTRLLVQAMSDIGAQVRVPAAENE